MPKKNAGKRRHEEYAALAIGSMQDEHGVCYVTIGIVLRSSNCCVMHANLGKRLAIGKREILRDEVAFLRRHGSERRGLLRHSQLRRAADKQGDGEHRRLSCEHSGDSPCDIYSDRSYTRARVKMQPLMRG